MKTLLLKITGFLLIAICLASCEKEEIFLSEIEICTISEDYSADPKHETYQAILDKYTKNGIVGLSLYVKKDNEIWQGSSGMASIENNIPLQPCHLAYSASIGKIYCAVAIVLLVESGKLGLDDKINLYLPTDLCNKIANGNKATIRQLLNHTAGIPNVDDDVNFGLTLFNDPYQLNRENIISYIYNKKALNEPGEVYNYSSTGYELLTMIIDEVIGDSHLGYYRDTLFNQYDLLNTYYKEPYSKLSARLPDNYFERYGNGKIENISSVNFHLQNALTGSDGIIATLEDYGLFIEKLMNHEIVSSTSLSEMKKFIPTNDEQTEGYGLGLRVRNSPYGSYIGHGGRSLGAGMDLFYFEDTKTTICLSTNLGTYVSTDLVDQYQGALFYEIVTAAFQ